MWECAVDDGDAGWQHTGLHVATLAAGEGLEIDADDRERIVIPLHGSFTVRHGAEVTRLGGRPSVFAGPTDVLYVPRDEGLRIEGAGRVAVASAPARCRYPSTRIDAADIAVELRGSGAQSRQVHNLGTPDVLAADRLIVCEVITPSGNWSSYPPHKHDEDVAGRESDLEEIYYFEAAPSRGLVTDSPPDQAFGLFTATGTDARPLGIDGPVRSGDVALVPWGYHGPAAAAPGYDLYYLNVMAGPGEERAWLITDEPQHAWIRERWTDEAVDPRLPFRDDRKRGER